MGRGEKEVKPKQEEEDALASLVSKDKQSAESMEIAEGSRQKEYLFPSFANQLFKGRFESSLITPFPKQSKDDREIGDRYIEKVLAFLKENLDPDEVDRTGVIPDTVLKGMAELGLFAMKVPKEYDGLGFSQTNYCRVLCAVSSYCVSTSVLLSAHQSIGVPQPLKMFGTKEQKEKYFPLFRKGVISAFALTEPGAGSDPAQITTEAHLSDDGTYYLLNGEKLWCTNGMQAGVIVVMAKTAPKIVKGKKKKQISAFILDMDTEGVERVHRCEFMGMKGIQNGVLRFKDVKIPSENLIWEEGKGLSMALSTINVGRLSLPAASLGGMKFAVSVMRRWGNERVQWGKPVGRHEAGKEKIAYVAAITFAIEAISYLTCAWSDSERQDLRIEAAMAKWFATEEAWKVVDKTLQLRGGRGYETALSLKARGEEGIPIERLLRDCRVNTILEGSSEIMRLFLTREAIDSHLNAIKPLLAKGNFFKKALYSLKLLGSYTGWYVKMWVGSFICPSHKEFGSLSHHIRYADRASKRLALKIFHSMLRYREGLIDKQSLLGRLVESGTEIFVMVATCSYALSLKEENSEKLADYLCKMMRRRIENRFYEVSHNDDKVMGQIADDTLDGVFKWLEKGIAKE